MTDVSSHGIVGALLGKVDDPSSVLKWLFGERSDDPIGPALSNAWSIIQCSDTLVWGLFQAGRWRWASEFDREVRKPSVDNLIEVRVFSPEREVLIWRTDEALLTGRIVTSLPVADESLGPLKDEEWLFKGSASEQNNVPFVARIQGGGNVVVTPLGRGVRVRKYVKSSPETGLLRVALTRFVEVLL